MREAKLINIKRTNVHKTPLKPLSKYPISIPNLIYTQPKLLKEKNPYTHIKISEISIPLICRTKKDVIQ